MKKLTYLVGILGGIFSLLSIYIGFLMGIEFWELAIPLIIVRANLDVIWTVLWMKAQARENKNDKKEKSS